MPAPEPPPEARLIARKREEIVPRLSRTQAAKRAGMSESRWRQLETGVIRIRRRDYPEVAAAETLARMAVVVSATPDELRAAGREDAAVILAKLLAKLLAEAEESSAAARAEAQRVVAGVRGLTARQQAALAERIARDIQDIREGGQ